MPAVEPDDPMSDPVPAVMPADSEPTVIPVTRCPLSSQTIQRQMTWCLLSSQTIRYLMTRFPLPCQMTRCPLSSQTIQCLMTQCPDLHSLPWCVFFLGPVSCYLHPCPCPCSCLSD
ncbi:unnamed protein product [Staurois parvus]|uniref:Uncharacterized protein n=1 Tax=Staurois parvus TaxID=386267 RepID=A0ABN9HCZ4_9NEOB|nr:unnamed protein product [Staurois parvus]